MQLKEALGIKHRNEKRLIAKINELNAEMVQNTVKLQAAVKISREDHETISTLRSQLEKCMYLSIAHLFLTHFPKANTALKLHNIHTVK